MKSFLSQISLLRLWKTTLTRPGQTCMMVYSKSSKAEQLESLLKCVQALSIAHWIRNHFQKNASFLKH